MFSICYGNLLQSEMRKGLKEHFLPWFIYSFLTIPSLVHLFLFDNSFLSSNNSFIQIYNIYESIPNFRIGYSRNNWRCWS